MMATDYPITRVTRKSSIITALKQQFAQGVCDMILTTESDLGPQGETLSEIPMVWMGALRGTAWKQNPLPLAFENDCASRGHVLGILNRQGIAWEMKVQNATTRAVEATVSADLAIHAVLAGSEPAYAERIPHGGALPDLGAFKVNMYMTDPSHSPSFTALAAMIRQAFAPRPSP